MAPLLRQLHDTPETAGQEQKTATLLRETLAAQGLEPVATDVAGHGLIYHLDGGKAGPRRLWRADLDALPDGHRCGHDGHMAMLAGALVGLVDAAWEGSITALFQPSEETGEGMRACLSHPRLQTRFDEAVAIHNVPGQPRGQIILSPGCLASTGLHIAYAGRTSHAAEPEAGLSPWQQMQAATQAAERYDDAIQGLATLVHVRLGGPAYGTSPGHGEVAWTVRAARNEAVSEIKETIMSAASGECATTATEVEPFPALRNDPDLLDRIEARLAGLDVIRQERPFLWSEDFSHASTISPIALVGLGAGDDQPPLHDPKYRFPEPLLDAGARFWMKLAGVDA